MDNKKYLEESARTAASDYAKIAERLAGPANINLLHAAMGMSTEANELVDALKKVIYYGKPLDTTNLIEELGDSLWYLAMACRELGVSMEEVMDRNIAKLKARYPDKFTEEKAENRDLEKEREILERQPTYTDDTYAQQLQPREIERDVTPATPAEVERFLKENKDLMQDLQKQEFNEFEQEMIKKFGSLDKLAEVVQQNQAFFGTDLAGHFTLPDEDFDKLTKDLTKKRDVEKDYEFWKNIVENPDGSINKEQLKKELSDFSMLIDNISKLYCLLSGGAISYPHTSPEAVYQEYQEQLMGQYNAGYDDGVADTQRG